MVKKILAFLSLIVMAGLYAIKPKKESQEIIEDGHADFNKLNADAKLSILQRNIRNK